MKKRLILAASLLLSLSCEDDNFYPEEVEVSLTVPLTLAPVKDTLTQGDTLWLEANFPDSLQDVYSGNYYKIDSSFNFRTFLVFVKLVDPNETISLQPGNVASYKIINYTGQVQAVTETYAAAKFKYDEYEQRFKLRTALVPSENVVNNIKLFRSSPEDTRLPTLDVGVDSQGQKRVAVMYYMHFNINNGNTNFELLQEAIPMTFDDPQQELLLKQNSFTFYLKAKE